jgi:hypothetical protein
MGEDLTMDDYLRPRLFSSQKIPWLPEVSESWAKAGRPPRVNGEWPEKMGFPANFQNTDYSKVPAGFRGANS